MPETGLSACRLYFIAPSGHGFQPLDIGFMESLCEKNEYLTVAIEDARGTPAV